MRPDNHLAQTLIYDWLCLRCGPCCHRFLYVFCDWREVMVAMSPAPLRIPREPLYVGIDVSKVTHYAGLVSSSLLRRHKQFSACPAFSFENSRKGFDKLLESLDLYAETTMVSVVMETTGHYHRSLQAFLQEQGIAVYLVHPQNAVGVRSKSDKIDELRLANQLYNQVERGAQALDASAIARRVSPPSPAAQQLRGLVRHRDEVTVDMTRRKNKLTAICDELFPEFIDTFKDVNGPTALTVRKAFPTPADVAAAPFDELLACRARNLPSPAALRDLQAAALHSIGVKDPARLHSLK